MPRLDVSFKQGPTPKKRGNITELRKYWEKFCILLRSTYLNHGHTARLIEVPLWQITENLVRKTSAYADLIYIPHKMKLNWILDDRVRYYMQMAIPNMFSIDESGWCASASSWPIKRTIGASSAIFSKLQERIKANQSKFAQPEFNMHIKLPELYILFPCQIPHDETIRFHSDVSVQQSLEVLLEWMIAYPSNIHLVIKGHPANFNSMLELKNIYNKFIEPLDDSQKSRFHWLDDISIHQLLQFASLVFTVNSGVGLEAILHYKQVFTFGNADYFSCSTKINFGGCKKNAVDNIQLNLLANKSNDLSLHKQHCHEFIDSWYNSHFDVSELKSFEKIIQ